ncbi:glycosyltransferase family 4 protein [Candidatus Sumerlaeota bacterium]|nr:glycosyltransferase family 4 protein [Candidatus Sumerlaeota bacterium]
MDYFNALHQSGKFDVEVLHCLPRFSERSGWPIPEGHFRHEYLPSRRLWSNMEFAVWNRGLAKRVRRGLADGRIHLVGGGYTMPSVALTMMQLARSGARWFYFSEKPGISANPLKSMLRHGLMRLCLGGRAEILAHSPLAVAAYRKLGFPEEKIHFLPYYMNVDQFRSIERPPASFDSSLPLRVLYCGRLLPIKGLDWAIEAFSGLGEAGKHCHLTIMGDGPQRELIEDRIKTLGIKTVQFIGEVAWNDRFKPFAEHDMLLFPSRHDGWGMAVMEAMASGMAVAGSRNAGAVAAYVKDGETGFQFDCGDVDGLRKTLIRCIQDRPLVLAMGRRAREVVANWTVENGVKRLIEILAQSE